MTESPEAHPDRTFRNIQFKGNATDYFGIWISNLVLTVVTLGIYSAWAKVRRIQYFYSHTEIADYPLGYHATGMQLLKGKIITIGVVGIYFILSIQLPTVSFAVSILFFLVLPWVINRSLKFRSRMTSWRNIRFNWHGNYWRSLLYFVVFPFLSVISLSLFAPVATKYRYDFYSKNHAFGLTNFYAEPTIGKFYKAFFLSVQLPVIVGIVAFVILGEFYIGPTLDETTEYETLMLIFSDAFATLAVLATIVFICGYILYFALCRNILLETLKLNDSVKFKADLNPFTYLWINISNSAAILLSLGLLVPWATVRKYRYLCEHTSYLFIKDESEFLDEELKKVHAFGEEYADWEGIDISI